MFSRSVVLSFLAVGLAVSSPDVAAVTLDWDVPTNTWTNANNGSPIPNSYDVDGVAGNDLTITISGQVSKLRTEPVSGTQTPAVMSTLQGGMGGEKSLHIYANVGTKSEITVSVSFSATYVQGVENVSFTLFDIDKTTDSEFIRNIYGIALDGTLIPATFSNLGSAVALTGSGLTSLLTGIAASPDGSSNGNVTISFGTNVIKGFAFTFDNSQGPPRTQEFGLHDISFTPVPEINPALSAVGSCLMAISLVFHHRSRVRSRRK
ncbi:MAG: hypothetical protein H0W20_16400 [Chthoniobacterales bacterium]|nr:hypothetical protein [Chthoniobacterales bacterium]